MKGRALGFAATGVLVSAVMMQPASATYSWSSLVYSPDGHHWSPEVGASILGSDMVLVPGDREDRTLYLGNQGGRAVHVGVSVRATGPDHWADTFEVEVRTGDGLWQHLKAERGEVVADLAVAADAEVPVVLRVSLPHPGSNTTMSRRLHLDVELTPAERTD